MKGSGTGGTWESPKFEITCTYTVGVAVTVVNGVVGVIVTAEQ